MRHHNITTLANEIYDKLANNTDNEMFDVNEPNSVELDCERAIITIEYQDKTFEVVIRERF